MATFSPQDAPRAVAGCRRAEPDSARVISSHIFYETIEMLYIHKLCFILDTDMHKYKI